MWWKFSKCYLKFFRTFFTKYFKKAQMIIQGFGKRVLSGINVYDNEVIDLQNSVNWWIMKIKVISFHFINQGMDTLQWSKLPQNWHNQVLCQDYSISLGIHSWSMECLQPREHHSNQALSFQTCSQKYTSWDHLPPHTQELFFKLTKEKLMTKPKQYIQNWIDNSKMFICNELHILAKQQKMNAQDMCLFFTPQ